MKKLYNKKGKVHPTPPLISDHLLTFLPATILTLTTALSPQDREVLAYLISCSSTPGSFSKQKKSTQRGVNGGGGVSGAEHSPLFNCNCFLCYTSYWVRWDSSPNRQLIHDIIDAYEDELASQSKRSKKKKERRKKVGEESVDLKGFDEESVVVGRVDSERVESVEVDEDGDGVGEDGEVVEEIEKGSVGKFVSFIGERIWGVWG